MRNRFSVFSLLLAVTLSAYAEPVGLMTLSLGELMQVQVTSSTQSPKNLKTVPAAVMIFRYEQRLRIGLDTQDELINLVPGFQLCRFSSSARNSNRSTLSCQNNYNIKIVFVVINYQYRAVA